jgi:hypothetical protein
MAALSRKLSTKVFAAIAVAAATTASLLVAGSFASESAEVGDASPIFGVRVPAGYRRWELIAPAQEAAPLDELRAVLGNAVAIKAYKDQTLPFPDGTILTKLAWKHIQSPDFEPASIPGAATTVQIMVKDSKKYQATGGWGFGRFIDGKSVDQAQHETCFACHEARVKDRDYVFTRYAK